MGMWLASALHWRLTSVEMQKVADPSLGERAIGEYVWTMSTVPVLIIFLGWNQPDRVFLTIGIVLLAITYIAWYSKPRSETQKVAKKE
jgi:hypothetical protein